MPCKTEEIGFVNGNVHSPDCQNMDAVNELHVNYGVRIQIAEFVCRNCVQSHCEAWENYTQAQMDEMNSNSVQLDVPHFNE